MKIFKLFQIFTLSLMVFSISAVEEDKDLPIDIWGEIANSFKQDIKNNIFTKTEEGWSYRLLTEEELFKALDSLRGTNKASKEAVDRVVKKTAEVLNKDPKTYRYADF